jgi:hypothetical protein
MYLVYNFIIKNYLFRFFFYLLKRKVEVIDFKFDFVLLLYFYHLK